MIQSPHIITLLVKQTVTLHQNYTILVYDLISEMLHVTGWVRNALLSRVKTTLNPSVIREKKSTDSGRSEGCTAFISEVFLNPNDPNPACVNEIHGSEFSPQPSHKSTTFTSNSREKAATRGRSKEGLGVDQCAFRTVLQRIPTQPVTLRCFV